MAQKVFLVKIKNKTISCKALNTFKNRFGVGWLLSPTKSINTNTQPTHHYLLRYSPICLPYGSHIDRRKPTIYAADHKQGGSWTFIMVRPSIRVPLPSLHHRQQRNKYGAADTSLSAALTGS